MEQYPNDCLLLGATIMTALTGATKRVRLIYPTTNVYELLGLYAQLTYGSVSRLLHLNRYGRRGDLKAAAVLGLSGSDWALLHRATPTLVLLGSRSIYQKDNLMTVWPRTWYIRPGQYLFKTFLECFSTTIQFIAFLTVSFHEKATPIPQRREQKITHEISTILANHWRIGKKNNGNLLKSRHYMYINCLAFHVYKQLTSLKHKAKSFLWTEFLTPWALETYGFGTSF